MANLNKDILETEVRRILDEFTLSGELVITSADMEDVASSNFESIDIGNELDRAARWTTSRVKSTHLPNLIVASLTVPLRAIRLLGSRVTFNSLNANRRTFNGDRKIEVSGRAATDAFPVYIFEDVEFEIRGVAKNPSGATADWIIYPLLVSELTDIFRNAVVQRTAAILFLVLGQASTAKIAFEQANAEIERYRLINLRST